jgi:hypothetical protein
MKSWPGGGGASSRPADTPLEVLAIGRLRRGASLWDLAFYEAADQELLRMLVRGGISSWPQRRADRRGHILKLQLHDLAEAESLLSRLPSVSAEVLTFELIPLVPERSSNSAAHHTGGQ